jgi:VIT1/CCC1 family predicted Fe2+/Mn2+ transporter
MKEMSLIAYATYAAASLPSITLHSCLPDGLSSLVESAFVAAAATAGLGVVVSASPR